MSTRLKLANDTSGKLDILSKKMGLRRNIICRLAIGRSLVDKTSVREYENENSLGFELNRTTVTGSYDNKFKAMIVQHEQKKINDFDFFSKYVRNHIERGVSLLFEEYEKINSPIEFLLRLINYDENIQMNIFSSEKKL